MPRLRLSGALPVQLLIAASSGVLLFLAHPPADLGPLAVVALMPFFWTLRPATPARGLALGFAFGFSYFGLLLYWILLFGGLAWGGLAVASAAYTALFGWLTPVVWRPRRPVASSFAVAALWTAVEFVRGAFPLGGFTWGDAAYTQAGNPPMLRLASLLGAWGVSFALVLANALLLEAILRWGRNRWGSLALVAVCGVLLLGPALIPVLSPNGPEVDLAGLQIDVPKDVAAGRAVQGSAVTARILELHGTLAGNPPQLAVWPEDSLDQDPTRDPALGETVRSSIQEVGSPVLAGAIMGPPGGRQYNQSLLFDPTGTIVERYSKVHLVPFGEYVPWRRYLGFIGQLEQIPRDLTPGRSSRPPSLDGMPFASVTCFENAFPSIIRNQVADGARFVIVSTNNASYLSTAATRQHLAMSRMRAAENARWILHDAISGTSAFVDPAGGVHQQTALFDPAVTRMSVTTSDRRTLYNRWGDWFPFGCILASAWLVLLPHGRRESGGPAPPLQPGARALVVLPTYNEAETIGEVMSRLLALREPIDVLVVDDGSPDRTAELVEEISRSEPRVRLLARPAKAGLASAYLDGFRQALTQGYDMVVEMDSDLSHAPEQLPALLGATRASNDLTIGSRYVPGGAVTNWGQSRRLLSRAGNLYARLCLGFPLTDTTSGYRVFRRRLLEHLVPTGIHSDGYGFQIELAFRAWKDGYAVGEVPITFHERAHGRSKISRRIVLEALVKVTRWGVQHRFRPGHDPFGAPHE